MRALPTRLVADRSVVKQGTVSRLAAGRRPTLPRGRAGLTLVEVAVTCVLLAVLAAVAIPTWLSTTEASDEARIRAEVESLAAAAEAVYTRTGAYPTGLGVYAVRTTSWFAPSTTRAEWALTAVTTSSATAAVRLPGSPTSLVCSTGVGRTAATRQTACVRQ